MKRYVLDNFGKRASSYSDVDLAVGFTGDEIASVKNFPVKGKDWQGQHYSIVCIYKTRNGKKVLRIEDLVSGTGVKADRRIGCCATVFDDNIGVRNLLYKEFGEDGRFPDWITDILVDINISNYKEFT